MTTDSTELVDETTEETNGYTDGYVAPEKKRSLGTLLSLGTYQGMTDEEIQSIIDYNVSLAQRDVEATTYRTTAQRIGEAAEVSYENIRQTNEEMLQSILNTKAATFTTSLETVTE